MDAQTVAALKAAFSTSPYNLPLLVGLLRAQLLLTQGDASVQDLAQTLTLSKVPEAELAAASAPDKLVVARVHYYTGQHDAALRLTNDTDAELLLLRARVLQASGKLTEAQGAYDSAVKLNPTLEDLELHSLLHAKVHDAGHERGPALRVIANDDTDKDVVTRLIAPEQRPIQFKDVSGLFDIKKQIERKIILPFKKPSMFQRFKRKAGGGILLYGPPGCGKTMLARATAGECNAQFFNVAIADVLDMYIGESERKLAALFEKARQEAPSVLFFDELEGLAGKRQYTRESTSTKLVSQFLSEMDGFSQANKGVLILGATNVPWAVDAAFRRPGRFDRVLFVPPPDRSARARILELLLKDLPTGADIDLGYLAKKTKGHSGADLKNLIETAADEAIEASLESGAEQPIAGAHIEQALSQVRSTTTEWLTTARNYARYANESGQYNDVLDFLNKHGKHA